MNILIIERPLNGAAATEKLMKDIGGKLLYKGTYQVVHGSQLCPRVFLHVDGVDAAHTINTWERIKINGLPVSGGLMEQLQLHAVVERLHLTYPASGKYGAPLATTGLSDVFGKCVGGAIGFENITPDYVFTSKDTGDDSGERFELLLRVPEETFKLVPQQRDVLKPILSICGHKWALFDDVTLLLDFRKFNPANPAEPKELAEEYLKTRSDAQLQIVHPKVKIRRVY